MGKTLLIGLDGMSFTLLDPFMKQGIMPFLAELVENGARSELMSTPCPVTPPAWTTVMTGRSPGNHGIYDFISVDDTVTDRIVFRLTNATDVLCETIWSIAGRQGKKAGALNFPQTFQSRPFNGYLVPGFVTSRHLRSSVIPREFWDTVKDLPGFSVKDAAWDLNEGRKALGGDLSKDECREWIDYLCRKETSWFAIARELVANTECELVAVVFEGMDRFQHQAWHILDPALQTQDPTDDEREMRDYCLRYYRLVDGFIRELAELAGKDSRVFVVSDHGFGSTTEVFYANAWLEKHGYLKWKTGAENDDHDMLTAHNMREHFDTIDWSKTTAYARTTSANGIYIRVAKNPGDPGIAAEDYMSFRARLVEGLRSYVDPETLSPVVTKIVTKEEAFPGISVSNAPDLTLTLRDGGFISILKSDEIIRPRRMVHGTHRPEGIFLAGGQGIRKNLNLERKNIVDVAPTILYSMELPIPDDFEGQVATDIFEDDHLRRNPVAAGPQTISPARRDESCDKGGMEGSDEVQIMERLKQLGYFE